MEHKEIFRALVGSHNYNLNTETSDYDYKVFIAPTFDDLYFNKMYSKSIIGDEQDLDIHDVRKVSNLWWKANVNFLEVLFSKEIMFGLTIKEETVKLIEQMLAMKHDIAKMNVPYLYNACIGMSITKMKLTLKGTEGTKHLVDKFGFDTKNGMHVIRILDFLQRFADTNFEDFEYAIRYEDGDSFKAFLFEIKDGKYTYEQVEGFIADMRKVVEHEYKERYMNMKPNEETNQKLIEIVKQIVKNELE